jgi:hypothetical protein
MATKNSAKRNIKDADLIKSIALPAAASNSVVTDYIDTGARTAFGSAPVDVDLVLTVPALSTTILPDTRTATLTIEESDDSAFGSSTTIATLVMTGAGGVGAAAAELRRNLSTNSLRYVRGKVAFGASTTTGAALSAEFSLRV